MKMYEKYIIYEFKVIFGLFENVSKLLAGTVVHRANFNTSMVFSLLIDIVR